MVTAPGTEGSPADCAQALPASLPRMCPWRCQLAAALGVVPAATPTRPQPAVPQWRLLCMDGAAFWVMKYSQVSDSLRNDGDQSIPFQGVIFFPFTARVSC